MAEQMPNAYMEGDMLVVRASSSGDCLRALWAAATGMQEVAKREWLAQTAQEGHLHEPDVRDRLREQDHVITEVQQVADWEVVPGKVTIRGHVDGRVATTRGAGYDPAQDAVLEIKSMSEAVFKEFEANRFKSKPAYAWQISAYMYAMSASRALYAYKNRNNGQLETFWIDRPPIDKATITRKMVELRRWVDRGEMPECDLANRFFCGFIYLHWEEGKAEEVDFSGEAAIDELADEYMGLVHLIKELTTRKSELRKGLISLVGHGARAVTDNHRIGVTQKRRTGLSKALLEDAFGDLTDYETRTEYEEVRVTKR